MKFVSGIETFPRYARQFVFFFTLALCFGYLSGFKFLMGSTDLKPSGIDAHYNGNEQDDDAVVMLFKKSENEILTTIHGHAISFSLIFLALGTIVITLPIRDSVKKFLMIEPFVSVIFTFGGIWLLWKGVDWFKYVVMLSGMMITVTFLSSVGLIFLYSLRRPTISVDID